MGAAEIIERRRRYEPNVACRRANSQRERLRRIQQDTIARRDVERPIVHGNWPLKTERAIDRNGGDLITFVIKVVAGTEVQIAVHQLVIQDKQGGGAGDTQTAPTGRAGED